MRVHLVGISGTGMGALAALFVEAGHEVSGSDVSFDPPMGPALLALRVRCFEGFDPAHLDPSPDLVVVGNAIRSTNPEAQEVERRGLARESMSGALRTFFLTRRRTLAVTGTHGKTTTSAMCAWLLSHAGLQPGWFIGGIPKGLPAGAAIGSTRQSPARGRAPFVVEGDEYDAAYWHKKPKFLDYIGVAADDVVILTSVEHDHIDIYPDVAAYESAFCALLRKVPERGLVFCSAGDERARAIALQEARARVVFFALEGDATGNVTPTWLGAPSHVTPDGLQTFDLFAGGMACGRYTMRATGRHNVRNAVATLAACSEAFGLDASLSRAHLATFEGVCRRQDLLGEPDGVRVYDDFAHHPTAVDETARALRSRHPGGALWVAFEPRSATACRSLHQDAYARSFDAADYVLLAPLGRTNVPDNERLDIARLARDLGPKAQAMPGIDSIVERLVEHARPGDTIGLFSNGAFGGIHVKLLSALAVRSARSER